MYLANPCSQLIDCGSHSSEVGTGHAELRLDSNLKSRAHQSDVSRILFNRFLLVFLVPSSHSSASLLAWKSLCGDSDSNRSDSR